MKLGTHIGVVVLPLFVLVGAASGWLRFTTEMRELEWGRTEAARSYAVALSEMWNGRELAQTKDESEAMLERFLSLNHRRVTGVIVFDRNGEHVIEKIKSPERALEFHVPFSLLGNEHVNEVFVSPLASDSTQAFARTESTTGEQSGGVGVMLEERIYDRSKRELLQSVIWQTVIVTALGLLCTMLLSQTLRRGMTLLERQLRSIRESVGYQKHWSEKLGFGLRELEELQEGIDIMKSTFSKISSEAPAKGGEQYSVRWTEEVEELAKRVSGSTQTAELLNAEILAMSSGKRTAGSFFSLFTLGDTVVVVRGSAEGDAPEERAKNAAAARAYSEELLKRLPVEEAWDEVRKVLPVTTWSVLRFTLPLDIAQYWETKGERGILHYRLIHADNGRLLFRSMDEASSQKLEEYLGLFPTQSPLSLKKELEQLLDENSNGWLVWAGAQK